ncbi:MAG: hypothetical protein H8D23_37920 [Candidatus Brocadiales bacterium]|nr:hypothetical protein [Candidatus Brocadiales bacterium]
MIRIYVALFILTLPFSAQSDKQKDQNIRWLGWPINGVYVHDIDPDFTPFYDGSYAIQAHQDIFIGLRSDGIVVWTALGKLLVLEDLELDSLKLDPLKLIDKTLR